MESLKKKEFFFVILSHHFSNLLPNFSRQLPTLKINFPFFLQGGSYSKWDWTSNTKSWTKFDGEAKFQPIKIFYPSRYIIHGLAQPRKIKCLTTLIIKQKQRTGIILTWFNFLKIWLSSTKSDFRPTAPLWNFVKYKRH